MGLIARKLFAFLKGVCRLVWCQLPLFVMLVVFTTIPAYFGESSFAWEFHFIKNYLSYVLPQVILICILLCWIAAQKRCFWYVIFVIANFVFFVELGCYFCQQVRFNSIVAILILQTNFAESKEFVDFAMIPILKAATCSTAIVVFFLSWNAFWKRGWSVSIAKCLRLNNRVVVCFVGVGLTLSIFYTPLRLSQCIKTYHEHWARLFPMSDASTIVVYYYALKDSFFNPEVRELDKLVQALDDETIDMTQAKDELEVVYVIGESFGRSRTSLHGYPLNTNPNMSLERDRGSLMFFDNVVSPSQRTIDVYRTMLSMNDILGDKSFIEYPLFLSIMKKCGYHVSYYDNQSVVNSVKMDFGCTSFLSNKSVQQQSIDDYNESREEYDGTFVSVYPLRKHNDCNLTIYHLMGQHSVFKGRYPEDFAKFSAADYSPFGYYTEEQAETVAEYDNATLYNDYVLSKIIDKLRDDVAIMVYAPDHGEEVYDYRNSMGRYLKYPDESIRLYFEVPVMIWVSDKFKELYPEQVDMLRKNTHKAIYNSDLPHTILDIAGIGAESFRPDLSLLRDGVGRTNRRILSNNYEYDANREKIRSYKMRYEN